MTINTKRNSGLGSLSVLYFRVVEIPTVKTLGAAGDESCAADVQAITPRALRNWATPSIKGVPAMGQRVGIGRKKMEIGLAPKRPGASRTARVVNGVPSAPIYRVPYVKMAHRVAKYSSVRRTSSKSECSELTPRE